MLLQQKQAVLERQDTINVELKSSEKEHRLLLSSLQDDLENELEKFKVLLKEKTDKARQDGIREVNMVQVLITHTQSLTHSLTHLLTHSLIGYL